MTPGQIVVDLDEIIVSQYGASRLDSAEEVHHSLFQLGFEPRDAARGVDFGKGHAEFVAQAPEAGKEDGASEEVILAVWFLKHDGEVVLDEAGGGGHGVFGQGAGGDVERFAGEDVVDARWGGGLEERRVAFWKVGASGKNLFN